MSARVLMAPCDSFGVRAVSCLCVLVRVVSPSLCALPCLCSCARALVTRARVCVLLVLVSVCCRYYPPSKPVQVRVFSEKGFACLTGHLILQRNTLLPFRYYKGIPSFPSDITREHPLSLQILQGIVLCSTAPYGHRGGAGGGSTLSRDGQASAPPTLQRAPCTEVGAAATLANSSAAHTLAYRHGWRAVRDVHAMATV